MAIKINDSKPTAYNKYLRRDLTIFARLFFKLNHGYINENHLTWY
jgi:hypothetical protein